MPAVPKTTHYTPKDKRTPNTTKPTFAKKAKPEKPWRTGLRRKRMLKPRKAWGRSIKAVAMKGYTYSRGRITRTSTLRPEGVRGKRLKPGDRREAKAIKGLPCICGCCLPVQWAHLIPRGAEATRHDPTYSVPACEYLHPWLDQGRGVQAKTELRNMATELGRRVTPKEAFDILSRWNYYGELAERRAKER